MVKRIIKFSATWCAPCRAFAPTFHKVMENEKYKGIKFEEFDVEKDEVGELYLEKYQIRNVPTTILLDEKDEVITKIMGNVSEDNFISIIDEKMTNKTE